MRTPSTFAFCVLLWLAPAAMAQTAPAPHISGEEPQEPAPPRSGQIVVVPPEAYQRVADEAGEIYTSRGYKGVVPGIRDESDVAAKKQDAPVLPDARPVVEWVGFQPFPSYSRVFIQVTGNFTFAATRPDANRIEVRVFGADVSTTNDLHELITRNFPTAVDRVTVSTSTADQGSVVVNVHLKAAVGYLYRQDGPYIFIDIEL